MKQNLDNKRAKLAAAERMRDQALMVDLKVGRRAS
jgi:hypothetical protein